MTILLPSLSHAASGKPMRIGLISLLVLFAVLFGGLVLPATAHAEDAMAAHGSEMFAMLEHAEDADHGDSHKQTGDEPCHVVSHHHCSVALAANAPSVTIGLSLSSASLLALADTAMSSFSQAPPTEPPAA